MITQTAEYALRACLHLARHHTERLPIPVIAEATDVPAGYLSKVLQTMRRAGLVHSLRGKKGGFSLLRDPADVSLYDIITAVNPIAHVESCPLTNDENCPRYGFNFAEQGTNLCPLHTAISETTHDVERRFRQFTLASFLEGYNHKKEAGRPL